MDVKMRVIWYDKWGAIRNDDEERAVDVEMTTTGDEDEKAVKLIDEALAQAYDCGVGIADSPSAKDLWTALMEVIGVAV